MAGTEQQRGKFHLPADHEPGMKVPHGGSMCANCRFLGDDRKTCKEKDFIAWNGSNLIPGNIEEYCSDWYRPRREGRWKQAGERG